METRAAKKVKTPVKEPVKVVTALEEENVLPALNEAKPKLEEKYCVSITRRAIFAVIYCLKHFSSKAEEARIEKAVEILDGACNLVVAKFRNCGYERRFYEKEYELQRALVDVIELYRDIHPDSQSWVTRVKCERDRASIFMNGFLERFSDVLESSDFSWIRRQEDAAKVRELETFALDLLNGGGGGLQLRGGSIGCFLDEIQGQLIRCFGSLLTVEPCDVHEMWSSGSDVPLVDAVPCISSHKRMAISKTNERVVNQEHIINGIFEILAYRLQLSHMTVRRLRGLFLLLGSTGTGKTEIAKAVAEHWYSDVSRLVEIDMSEYAEEAQMESASCDLFAGSKRKYEDFSLLSKRKDEEFWNRLAEVVRRRPYSVILLDNIEKATFSVESLLGVLSNDKAPTGIEGNVVDFSKSIIFMTSSVGANQKVYICVNRNRKIWRQFKRDPAKLRRTLDSSIKAIGLERVVIEAKNFFGAELLDSFDKVFAMERLEDKMAVSRILLREIVREVLPEERFLVHFSHAASTKLLCNPQKISSTAVKAIKETILAGVTPWLSAEAGGYNSGVVYVDTLVGTYKLSFRFEARKQSLADCYFKQKDGTFDEVIANLRKKVESAYRFFELRKKCLPLLDHSGQNFEQLGRHLLLICDSLQRFSPFATPPPPKSAFEEVLDNHVITVEEKEKIKNARRRLVETDSGIAKATRIIVDALVKIIDAHPLQLPDSPADRYYLFLCLDDDAKRELIRSLTESLISCDSKESLFTYITLMNNNCRGEDMKKLVIEEVKERPCAVFMLDGVEYADGVLYSSLLEIFDKGALDDGDGSTVDFRRAIFILTSEVANRSNIADLFDYQPSGLCNIMDQDVKRFRIDLLHRIDEIILFDPILPEHGSILRLPKRNIRFMRRPANLLLHRVLFQIFDPLPYMPGESPAKLPLPGTLMGDIYEVMRC